MGPGIVQVAGGKGNCQEGIVGIRLKAIAATVNSITKTTRKGSWTASPGQQLTAKKGGDSKMLHAHRKGELP